MRIMFENGVARARRHHQDQVYGKHYQRGLALSVCLGQGDCIEVAAEVIVIFFISVYWMEVTK